MKISKLIQLLHEKAIEAGEDAEVWIWTDKGDTKVELYWTASDDTLKKFEPIVVIRG